MTEELINRYSKCATYHKGSENYNELDAMSDYELSELAICLEKNGFCLTYNLNEDCYCVA